MLRQYQCTLLASSVTCHKAKDAGEFRIYGGIHFYEGNAFGLELGKNLGTNAFRKARAYWTGIVQPAAQGRN